MKLLRATPLLVLSCLSFRAASAAETLSYHPIRTDPAGKILPWYSDDLGASYDHVVGLTWTFWINMRRDPNGIPYYMEHQVWRPDFNDRRGIGGDQFAMALSSFGRLYAYTGDEAVKEEMRFIADYYTTHGLSAADAAWPNIPYPYNTRIYSGVYDGDMIIGRGYTQPDKAGSFGWELLKLYEMSGNVEYLTTARAIADTLAAHVQPGDHDHSPLPFKVNATTGEVGKLRDNVIDQPETSNYASRPTIGEASYTTNYAGTLELFLGLHALGHDPQGVYQRAFDVVLAWMRQYPLANNRWGPFFEDIPGWSDTQINAVTFARFILDHRDLFPEWRTQVRGILDWVYKELPDKEWERYGVLTVCEQTAYRVPGNSHTSRQAAAELRYAELTGDTTWKENAIRQLSWATYMVDSDGKNRYPRDDIWLTDGYGDYIRHFLDGMAAAPELAPANQDHILRGSSPFEVVEYAPAENRFFPPVVPLKVLPRTVVHYRTFAPDAAEELRLRQKPHEVLADGKALPEAAQPAPDAWHWRPLATGGVLTVQHTHAKDLLVLSSAAR